MTPGAIDPAVTLDAICNGTTKSRRRVPTSRCDAVFRAYSIPDTPIDRYSYQCDHRVPPGGGRVERGVNLWPQPDAEAALKDVCEVRVQGLVCTGAITLDRGQAVFLADDWGRRAEQS